MKKQKNVGVVIGRFQVPDVHDGHQYLIDRARMASERLLILVGSSGGWTSKSDPLDFETRKAMLASLYPTATIIEITDHPSNEAWSNNIDHIIEKNFAGFKAVLFGSRDSFLPYYLGKHAKKYVLPKKNVPSGTDMRNKVGTIPLDSREFRAGAIYAGTKQNFPTSFQAVDIAIRHTLESKVLIGRKAGETGWRFPGGFVDPKDSSLEMAAKREALEEVGDIEIGDVKYLSSVRINDHRYRKSEHKVMTALFSAKYIFGSIRAQDDLAEVRWESFDTLVDCLIDGHKTLGEIFLQNL